MNCFYSCNQRPWLAVISNFETSTKESEPSRFSKITITLIFGKRFQCNLLAFPIIFNPLQWCHYERVGVSHHRRIDSLLNRLFGRWWKKTSTLRVTSLLRGIHRSPVNSPHKGPVKRRMLPFDDVIMTCPCPFYLPQHHYMQSKMRSH